MYLPAQFVNAYVDLFTWILDGSDWSFTGTPILHYLQSGKKPQSPNAQLAHQRFMSRLAQVDPKFTTAKTFNYNDYDYINLSIRRCFIGKACPWEIQETLQLASELGLTNPDTVYKYCSDNLGVDCGGFVAAYWGEGVPHMADTQPVGSLGFLPRTFWSDSHLWPDVRARRRKSAGEISPGDAAIFFKDIKGDDPDIAKQRDSSGTLIEGTGSEAFHIGLVNSVSGGGDKITQLEIAESSGAASKFGSDGVNVRFATIQSSGIAKGLIYAQTGANERIYFLGPPAGWGPELPYTYGEE
ncbi:hypothetical protein [Plasticicumulans sp.]|uniref:hypothetical protein n=1 Tax=Plasticicumulans sp. TaxID=2307179 RepID=UPI002B5D2C95|nr:hypothetical protein [Plasticicumulans sp.]HMV40027.1 hypothetical protein [Plasticicumulans sp.]HMW30630.1 hypothetical protein [Plasticicumulans sp.]HMX52993.1 hypothetical protein [Plasticicumulans sp.]HNI23217.1 hypothetical protein [Plasticicumulans sp.]